ncbi:MAG: S-layer homology domain-containing protein [Clostridia bacterium]|nr:S-layer homology domain-containing protein [Clostridia bacterium]
MKKLSALILILVLLVSQLQVYAIHETTASYNEKYASCIDEAIANTRYGSENLDRENVYIIEDWYPRQLLNDIPADKIYVAAPILGTDDSSYTRFDNGVLKNESILTPTLVYAETHLNSRVNEYIENNNLTDVTEAVSTIYHSQKNMRTIRLYTYRVVSGGKTYFIPYYVGNFNAHNDETCTIELGKAYSKDEFISLTEREQDSYAEHKAKLKAEEEAKKYAEEHPVFSIDENGETFVKIAGVNLEDVKKEILSYVETMADNSKMEINYSQNGEKHRTTHAYKKGQSSLASCKYGFNEFINILFEEIYTQADNGTVGSDPSLAYFSMDLRKDVDGKKYQYSFNFSVTSNSIRINISDDYNPDNNRTVNMRIKNSDFLVKLLENAHSKYFSEFVSKSYDETTTNKIGTLDELTKTDEVNFKFNLTEDIGASITKEVSSLGKTVTGKLEKYKENKYRWTYVLTLSGDLGTISMYEEYQASWDYTDIYFANNQPIRFSDKHRLEDGELVRYVLGKTGKSLELKLVCSGDGVTDIQIEKIKCTDIEYTAFTEDMNLTEIFVERSKEDVIKENEDKESKTDENDIKSDGEKSKDDLVKSDAEKINKEDVKKETVTDTKECADILHGVGLFKGTNNGYELEKSLTREESATILVRLLGEEDKINADDFTEVFTDVDKDRWSYANVMYCYANNITKGTGDNKFSPDEQIDAKQFVTLMLRLLGYTDVTPENALWKAAAYDLIDVDTAARLESSECFTRSEMVIVVYSSLSTQMSDETVFSEYLLENGVLTQAEAELIK